LIHRILKVKVENPTFNLAVGLIFHLRKKLMRKITCFAHDILQFLTASAWSSSLEFYLEKLTRLPVFISGQKYVEIEQV